jgi:hypothetical protein
MSSAEAVAAAARITGGNARLVQRLFAQIARVLEDEPGLARDGANATLRRRDVGRHYRGGADAYGVTIS